VSTLTLLGLHVDANTVHEASNSLGDFGDLQCFNVPMPPSRETMSIHVRLELEYSSEPQAASTPRVNLCPNDRSSPQPLHLMPLARHSSYSSFLSAFPMPSSPLSLFSSLIGLLSPFPLSGETIWTVYQNDAPIHHEQCTIRLASPHLPISGGWHLYVCDLVPSLWPTLCEHDSAYFSMISWNQF
jgi:hypothetical protein